MLEIALGKDHSLRSANHLAVFFWGNGRTAQLPHPDLESQLLLLFPKRGLADGILTGATTSRMTWAQLLLYRS